MQRQRSMRIIIEQTQNSAGWLAWFADRPHDTCPGQNTKLAVKKLLDSHPDRVPNDYKLRVDKNRSHNGHFELTLWGQTESAALCPECNGSGNYVGLNVVESCHGCDGSGQSDG